MARIRVLVVDDSVVVRKLVTDVINADPGLEVAATAPNGRIALSKIEQVVPDLVVLDVEMPVLDGLDTLRALRERYPRLPVIMFSTLTERGASVTMEALMLGAKDYVTKPANVGSVNAAIERVREELVPKIRGLFARPTPALAPAPSASPTSTRRSPTSRPAVEAVVIGVSTGGPNALATLLPQLPPGLGAPVLVVQHMPPMFTGLLAERLDGACPVTVREAAHAGPIDRAAIWIAPGDQHLLVDRAGATVRVATDQSPPQNSCRPSVDVLFRSAAAIYGAGTLAVMLTGMGQDGLRGSEAIVEAGGALIAQDEASSVVWGMPGAVARAGLAEEVLGLDDIAGAITRRVTQRPARVGASERGRS